MKNSQQLTAAVSGGTFDSSFARLYPHAAAADSRRRYTDAIAEFVSLYGESNDLHLFSTPGRTEVTGNHTDHQHGCVVAAGIDLDIIAIAAKNDDGVIRLKSKGYDMDTVRLDELDKKPEESGRAISLIRGIASRFKQLGYEVGGFDAYTTSNVLKGSGLSSSAAFEVMVCTLLNGLYNGEKMDAVEKAIVSQYAENEYFDKPCGLMDQTACSVGGFVAIDFCDPAKPVVEKIDFDFAAVNHSLCIVDTGGCHADLTDDYAAVPAEMKTVAQFFEKSFLREVDEKEFFANVAALRQKVSDRSILRAIHFYKDNANAIELRDCLKNNDFESFKRIISASGRSSLAYLQNVFASSNPNEQGLTLALALSERILNGRGAYRVHGGGFAGTIQAFVPDDLLETYKAETEAVFGENSCYCLSVRPFGGIEVTESL